ncbi:hypothetical protein LTR17_000015 [Elasticomyces elasticus]|nr:hypothetical protein LTR17_000015 [Elasticomyces elasticus]
MAHTLSHTLTPPSGNTTNNIHCTLHPAWLSWRRRVEQVSDKILLPESAEFGDDRHQLWYSTRCLRRPLRAFGQPGIPISSRCTRNSRCSHTRACLMRRASQSPRCLDTARKILGFGPLSLCETRSFAEVVVLRCRDEGEYIPTPKKQDVSQSRSLAGQMLLRSSLVLRDPRYAGTHQEQSLYPVPSSDYGYYAQRQEIHDYDYGQQRQYAQSSYAPSAYRQPYEQSYNYRQESDERWIRTSITVRK